MVGAVGEDFGRFAKDGGFWHGASLIAEKRPMDGRLASILVLSLALGLCGCVPGENKMGLRRIQIHSGR